MLERAMSVSSLWTGWCGALPTTIVASRNVLVAEGDQERRSVDRLQ